MCTARATYVHLDLGGIVGKTDSLKLTSRDTKPASSKFHAFVLNSKESENSKFTKRFSELTEEYLPQLEDGISLVQFITFKYLYVICGATLHIAYPRSPTHRGGSAV